MKTKDHPPQTASPNKAKSQSGTRLLIPDAAPSRLDTPAFIEDLADPAEDPDTLPEQVAQGDTQGGIVLASSSSYRKALLSRILDDFISEAPDIDEQRKTGEALQDLAERLAIEKARKLSKKYPKHLIIGSDQVACLTVAGTELQLGKPHTKERCIEQLEQCQGNTVIFYTGLCLLNSATGQIQSSVERYETRFRKLNAQQIWHYIEREPALDCAGGFKMEGLGIALFEHIRGDDPNTLIGLPLIKLVSMLQHEGYEVLTADAAPLS